MSIFTNFSNRAAAALTALVLSVVLIGGTVSVPGEAQAHAVSYGGVIA